MTRTTMTRTTLAPWTWQEAFGFAQGAEVRAARTVVYVAGQGSVDADGNPVHDGDMEKQVVQALDNVEAVLAEAGLTLADVVRYDVHTTDIDAYLAASGALVGRFAAVGNVPVGESSRRCGGWPSRRCSSRSPARRSPDSGRAGGRHKGPPPGWVAGPVRAPGVLRRPGHARAISHA
jgi:enamine deaminase RidA (YjgF/YER057c/UK114 family)